MFTGVIVFVYKYQANEMPTAAFEVMNLPLGRKGTSVGTEVVTSSDEAQSVR